MNLLNALVERTLRANGKLFVDFDIMHALHIKLLVGAFAVGICSWMYVSCML